MTQKTTLFLTALAPTIWGSTYLVTTEGLPAGYPLTVAMLRALPAGLLLLLLTRRLPHGIWWLRIVILGALNFSLFWWFLFIAAYRLPGGVAATVGAIQPLLVLILSRFILNSTLHPLAVIASLVGINGVALLLLTPQAALDPVGIIAGIGGAISMAIGTVMTRRWQPPVSPLTFTAWQLTAGGFLLLPAALWFEPPLPTLTTLNILSFAYLGLIGAALTYILWFRGIAKLGPATVSSLNFLSPMTAVILGWFILGQQLSFTQFVGIFIVFGSVWLSQHLLLPAVAK